MHILFLSDNFPPETNAPASRTFEHCREWVQAGHQVTVITCVPNFPKGEVFPGYHNQLWQEEPLEGITVLRVWSYISPNEGFLRRSLDYASFMFSAIALSPLVRGVDVVVGTSPQFFTVCAAYAVSRLVRKPFVFELRDLWPESIRAVGAMGDTSLFRLLQRLELFLYRRAARIVAVTESFRDHLICRGIPAPRIEVVTNGVDTRTFQPRERDPRLVERFGLQGKFVAGYIGTHGMAHALNTLLEVARRFQHEENDPSFVFLFLGDGAAKCGLIRSAQEQGLSNVLFLDPVPRDQVVRYWSLLDVAVIHLRRAPLFETVIPSKLFECMAMGIPVVHGVPGESAGLVQREGIGIVFEPENPVDLGHALRYLKGQPEELARFRQNCLSASRRYDRRQLARQLLGVLESLVPGACTDQPPPCAQQPTSRT